MIYVLGTRTTSEEVADLIPPEEFGGYIENQWWEKRMFAGKPVFWVDSLSSTIRIVVPGIASAYQRRMYVKDIVEEKKIPVHWATIVHESASVSHTASVGKGSVISRQVVVACRARVGAFCFINRHASIGHHTELEDYVTVSPRVVMGGCCQIGKGAYIGMGAILVEHVHIGENAFVAAGAVVIKNVPPNTAVIGVPAKPFTPHEGSRVWERIDGSKYRREQGCPS